MDGMWWWVVVEEKRLVAVCPSCAISHLGLMEFLRASSDVPLGQNFRHIQRSAKEAACGNYCRVWIWNRYNKISLLTTLPRHVWRGWRGSPGCLNTVDALFIPYRFSLSLSYWVHVLLQIQWTHCTRKTYHTSILTGEGWVIELLTGHPKHIQCELRVFFEVFILLIDELWGMGYNDSKICIPGGTASYISIHVSHRIDNQTCQWVLG